MTRKELTERRDKAVKAMETMSKTLQTEKRVMTPDEKRKWKQHDLEASESKQLIAQMDKAYEAEQKQTAAALKKFK